MDVTRSRLRGAARLPLLPGALLAVHYAVAGTTFGPVQLLMLALLFTACAGAVGVGLRRTRAVGRHVGEAARRMPSGPFCVAVTLVLTAAALGFSWLEGGTSGGNVALDAAARWPRQGFAAPVLVATFVAAPLLIAAWLGLGCLAVGRRPFPCDRRGTHPRHVDADAGADEDLLAELAEFNAARSRERATPPA